MGVFDNGLYARDCSKKIKAVFKSKGQSGKPLASTPPYGYKKSETDKNVWEVNDEPAQAVRRIFKMCIKGLGPAQIARQLRSENILIPTAYAQSKGRGGARTFKNPTRWEDQTVNKILDRIEYAGHTVNFKTHNKSYKNKRRIENSALRSTLGSMWRVLRLRSTNGTMTKKERLRRLPTQPFQKQLNTSLPPPRF